MRSKAVQRSSSSRKKFPDAYEYWTIDRYVHWSIDAYGHWTIDAYGNWTIAVYGHWTMDAYGHWTIDAYGFGQSTHTGDDNARTNGSHVDRLLALILGEKTILDFEASRRLGFVAVKDHAHLVRPARPFELPGAAKTLSAPRGKVKGACL